MQHPMAIRTKYSEVRCNVVSDWHAFFQARDWTCSPASFAYRSPLPFGFWRPVTENLRLVRDALRQVKVCIIGVSTASWP
jgi:hypothetical protein